MNVIIIEHSLTEGRSVTYILCIKIMKAFHSDEVSINVYDAIRKGNYTWLEKSLDRGKSANAGLCGRSPICHAINEYGDHGGTRRFRIIELLIEKDADVNQVSDFSELACITPGKASSMKEYADTGHPWTPVFFAVFKGVHDVVQLLMESGADATIKCTLDTVNVQSFGQLSPAELAHLCGYQTISNTLIETQWDIASQFLN